MHFPLIDFYQQNLLSRIPKLVELSHEWVLTNFKYQEPEFYSRLFDESEKGTFEVPTGRTNKYKSQHLMLLICMFSRKKRACVFCSFSSSFYFIGDKISADGLKY